MKKIIAFVFLIFPTILPTHPNHQKLKEILDNYEIKYNSLDFIEKKDKYNLIIEFFCHQKTSQCLNKMNLKLENIDIYYVVYLTYIVPERVLNQHEKYSGMVRFDMEKNITYKLKEQKKMIVVLDQSYKLVLRANYNYKINDVKFFNPKKDK